MTVTCFELNKYTHKKVDYGNTVLKHTLWNLDMCRPCGTWICAVQYVAYLMLDWLIIYLVMYLKDPPMHI